MRCSWTLIAALIAAFLSPWLATPAYAYLDPGTGSYFLQLWLFGVLLWLVPPIFICRNLAKQKGYPSGSAGFLGFLLGWVAVLFYALRSDKRKDAKEQAARIAEATRDGREILGADTRACPYCAETIKAKAKVCRFCGRDVT
jgi:hypothetical protein